MAKYENIRALAKKQLQAVTESSDRWKAFLRTAAIAYNYSFPNQLLIHEQSPTATAVADIAYWNNNAGRWVKRGAHGIAVFDTRANSSRLRYLFDISDTIPRAEVPDALPWVITDQNWRPVWDKIVADNHADSIQSALLMLSTSCVAQRSAMFTTALGKAIDGSSLQWAKPDEQRQLFIQLITQSCLYMAALRCGVDTARLDLSALESVNQFDSQQSYGIEMVRQHSKISAGGAGALSVGRLLLYARPSRPPPRRGTWYGQVGQRPQTKHQVPQHQRLQRKLHLDRECTLQHRQPRA